MTEQVEVRDAHAAVAAFIANGRQSMEIDPEQAALDIVRRILSGASVDDVLGESEALHAKDVLGVTLAVTGVRWNQSDMADGPGFYALMECVDDKGEPFVVTCGALSCMAQLYRLDQLEAFPIRLCIEEVGKPTAAGYRPMHLRKGEEPF